MRSGPSIRRPLPKACSATDDGEIGVTRVVPRDARSRAYLDGTLAASAVLEERIGGLVEIVGQHDRLLLQRSQTVLALVDAMLDGPGLKTRDRYVDAWARYRSAVEDQRRLGGDRTALERELDLLRYQANEIAGAGLERGDDLRFESMAARLKNAEAMRENLTGATEELERLAESSGEVVSRLRKLAVFDPEMADPMSAAEGLDAVAHDLLRDLRAVADSAFEDPAALETVEQRLTTLGELKRKYGRTLDDVLEFGAGASRRASELEQLIQKASTIDDLLQRSSAELAGIGADLSTARSRVAARSRRKLALTWPPSDFRRPRSPSQSSPSSRAPPASTRWRSCSPRTTDWPQGVSRRSLPEANCRD